MDKFTKIFLIVIGAILGILLIVVIGVSLVKSNNKYDTSNMKVINESDAVELFESGQTYVLMFGYEECDVCKELLPMMEKAQVELNFITQYIDVFSVDFESEDWATLVSKLTMESTQTVTQDGSGDPITETYGYFLDNYAMVPTVVVIKDGEQIGGFIGGVAEEDLIPWLESKLS